MTDTQTKQARDKLLLSRREKYTRIKALACFPEVQQRLIGGVSIPDIARFIQTERQEYLDVEFESLVTMLAAYKREMPPAEIMEVASPGLAKEVERARERFGDMYAELEELAELVVIQKKNVAAGLKLVESSNFPQRQLGLEVLNLAAVITKMHDIKMDLGLTKPGGRDLGTVTITPGQMTKFRDKYGNDVGDAMGKPESRSRALAVVKQLTAALGNRLPAIDVEVEEDDDGDEE